MSILFGDYIRSRREALRKGDARFSIRQVANRIGVHHSYLSKVERGEPAALSEKVINALAWELNEEPNLLMAMNGRISEDMRRAVFDSPDLFSRMIGEFLTPKRPGNGKVASTLLHGLRDMTVLQLDKDLNVAWGRRNGMIDESLDGRKCYAALFGTDVPCPGCPAMDTGSLGKFRVNEVPVPDGCSWLVSSTPIRDKRGGGPHGYIVVSVDVTKGLAVEQSMRESERLMFHDLKSPLAGVLNMALVLRDDDNLSPEQVEGLTVMAQATRRLLNHISGALDIHLMEVGQLEYVPKRINAVETVRSLVREFSSFERFADIGLELSLNGHGLREGDNAWVMADTNMMERGLGNLLTNAFEASDRGDVVRISVEENEMGVTISISNRQPVPEAIRDRMFEKFVTCGKDNGVGLGSYSAKLLAEHMGGSVGCKVCEKDGTTVTLTLPS